MILIELVQRFQPGDWRLVYRKLPWHVFADLSRGLLLSRSARLLSPASALLLSALWPTLLPWRGLGTVSATMVWRIFARVTAARTLGAISSPLLRCYAAPGILALRFRSFIERAVSIAGHAFVNALVESSWSASWVGYQSADGRSASAVWQPTRGSALSKSKSKVGSNMINSWDGGKGTTAVEFSSYYLLDV